MTQDRDRTKRLAKEMSDAGLLVEAGWQGFCQLALEGGMDRRALHELRIIFFAGAAHLFNSMHLITDDEENSEQKKSRLRAVNAELTAFEKQFNARFVRRPTTH